MKRIEELTDRDLDALVAEKVMGHAVEKWGGESHIKAPDAHPTSCAKVWHDIPHYSTDISAAWQVVEKLTTTTKQWFRLEQWCTGTKATFEISGAAEKDGEWSAEDLEAPRAICLAALTAEPAKEKP
jgi:hypothetical protein